MKQPWSVRLYRKAVILAVALSVVSCKESSDLQSLRETAERGNESYKQYKSGDYPTAKAALLGYIRYLEDKMRDPEYPHAETAKSDIMISYVRLATLEDKNNGDEKENYMRQAVASCQQLKIKWDCSPEALHGRVDGLDAQLKK